MSCGAPCPRVPGVEFGERPLDGERGAHRALGVVLLRFRIAEQGHQTIAEPFQYVAAKARHRLRSLVEIGPDEIAPILRVEPRRKARRANEIAEHHGDRAALGGVGTCADRDMALRRDRIHAFGTGGGRGVELLNRRNDFAPMADDSDAEILEVLDRQLRQHRAVDFVVAERRLVLPKAEAPQPNPDIHRCFLRRAASMMVLRGRSVYGADQGGRLWSIDPFPMPVE